MTAQAHEKLVLDGQNFTMTSCPPLPKNEPRIKQSVEKTLSSACWRGYIGTWEIRGGRFYLIDVSMNLTLDEGPPIFAEWFSGEISVPKGSLLNYVHGGFASTYEREQRIRINKGLVVESVLVSNIPAHPEASRIRDFLESRGVKNIIHFTKIKNLPGILTHGLMGRERILKEGLAAEFNDKYRYDNLPNAVCASISFPNYRMFYRLQQKNPGEDWAVLRIDSRVLWEIPCAYCYSNAASNKVTKIPVEERMSFSALVAMFEDIQPDILRSQLKIPDEYTTDPQAEILILGSVDPAYILDINFNNIDGINDMNFVSDLAEAYSRFEFRKDERYFTYRLDYEKWRSDQTSIVDF